VSAPGGVLGLIPARGGSRGIPRKNLVPLAGKPLLGWVAEQGLRSQTLSDVVVSSDDPEIIAAARSFGVRAPFVRPAGLSGDEVLVVEVLAHALRWLRENEGAEYEYACLLQPTAPLALAEDYDRAVRTAFEKSADTVISVARCGQLHPAIMFTLADDGSADWFLKAGPEGRMARRQDLPPLFIRTGVVYVVRSSLILEQGTLYGEKLYAVKVPEERAIGIDTPLDLEVAAAMLARRGKRSTE
jgi:CMP-N-acetylneuraminic acid synthetase